VSRTGCRALVLAAVGLLALGVVIVAVVVAVDPDTSNTNLMRVAWFSILGGLVGLVVAVLVGLGAALAVGTAEQGDQDHEHGEERDHGQRDQVGRPPVPPID
jgi:hypothetical protein